MAIKLIKKDEGTVYQAPNHFGFWGIKKVTEAEGSKNLVVSISEFHPNGGATMSSSPKDRVYICMRGAFNVHDEAGTTFALTPGDMVYIPANEKRDMEVVGTEACRVMVLMCSPE